MEPRYEDAVIEALENSYGEFPDRSGLAACLLETAKVIVEDNFSDYLTELRASKRAACWKNWMTSVPKHGLRAWWRAAWLLSC